MTSREKAIEVLKKYCVSEQWFKDNASDEDVNGCDEAHEYNEAVEYLATQPTIDDCIAVVEKMFEQENERLRKVIQSYYSKSWLVTLSKNILDYNITFQKEIQSALKVLKEGK